DECAGSILCRCRCGSYAGKMAKLGISLQNLTQYSEGCTEMYTFVCLCLAFKEFIFCEAMFFAIELTRFFEINVLKTECGCTIDLTKELACIYIIQSLKATGLHYFNRRSKCIAVKLSHTYILIVHI